MAVIGGGEQVARFMNPALAQVLHRGDAEIGVECARQIVFADARLLRQPVQGDFLLKMFVDQTLGLGTAARNARRILAGYIHARTTAQFEQQHIQNASTYLQIVRLLAAELAQNVLKIGQQHALIGPVIQQHITGMTSVGPVEHHTVKADDDIFQRLLRRGKLRMHHIWVDQETVSRLQGQGGIHDLQHAASARDIEQLGVGMTVQN